MGRRRGERGEMEGGHTLNSLLRHQVLSKYRGSLVILYVRSHNYSRIYLLSITKDVRPKLLGQTRRHRAEAGAQ